MKAVRHDRFGGPEVLEIAEVPRPSAGPGEVLVRIRAASTNARDWHFMRALPFIARPTVGWRKPKIKILGSDFAGEVEATGEGVTRFQPGDDVFGYAEAGAFAEYVSLPENALAMKPARLSFEQAATVPLAGVTALQGLRDIEEVGSGMRVLIVGASGGVGTFAVQIAKSLGAHVTGVCSTPNVDLVHSIGANDVIDYTQHDFTRGDQKYDVIFQLAGTTSPAACRRALTPTGTLVLSSGDTPGRFIGPMGRVLKAVLLSAFVKQTLKPLQAKVTDDDLNALCGLIEAGKVEPVIDRTYRLNEVQEAIRYLETGRTRGKSVILVAPIEEQTRRDGQRHEHGRVEMTGS